MFVGLGAVVTIGVRNQELSQDRTGLAELPAIGQEPFLDVPLECVEVVGRSLLERMIERFVAIGLERVSFWWKLRRSSEYLSFELPTQMSR